MRLLSSMKNLKNRKRSAGISRVGVYDTDGDQVRRIVHRSARGKESLSWK
jgi:hypothetical protein